MTNERGGIHDRERAKQQIDYRGLLYGKITPTDIDGLIEYHNKGYILIEAKLRETIVPNGQKLAFERLTDDLTRGGKPTLCVIIRHEIDDPTQDIDAVNTTIREYRWEYKWIIPTYILHTKDAIDNFVYQLDNLS